MEVAVSRRRGQEVLRGAEAAGVPEGGRLREVPRGRRRRPRPTSAPRASSTCSRTKIRDKVRRGHQARSPTRLIADFYAKNKHALRPAREARPARRADQGAGATPSEAHAALERGDVVEDRRPSATRSTARPRPTGGKLPGAGQGHARHRARQGGVQRRARASSSARSRPSTATTSSRSRGVVAPHAADTGRGQADDPADARRRGPAEGARRLHRATSRKRWREKTQCAEGFKTPDCANGPKRPHTDAAYAITYGRMPPREWDASLLRPFSDPQLAMARDVIDRLDLRGDERVLDAGCGTGRVTQELLAARPERHRDRGRRQPGDGRADARAAGDRVEAFAVDLLDLERRRSRSTRSSRPRPSTGSTITSGCSRACTPR